MDGIQDCDEILLAQSIDVVADNKFEASESASNDKVTFMLQRFTYRNNNDSPSFVLDLLSTVLDDLLEAFNDCQFITIVV